MQIHAFITEKLINGDLSFHHESPTIALYVPLFDSNGDFIRIVYGATYYDLLDGFGKLFSALNYQLMTIYADQRDPDFLISSTDYKMVEDIRGITWAMWLMLYYALYELCPR